MTTPGKWTVKQTVIDGEPSDDFFDVVTRTEQVAAMIAVQADAQLISAAPELLAALRLFANLDQSVPSGLWAVKQEYCEQARQAIAKATVQEHQA